MHTNPRTLFRGFVVAHLVLGVICYVTASFASGSWRTMSDPATFAMEITLWALDVAAAVGLFLFRRWARWLFIILFALSAVVLITRPGPIAFGSLAGLGLLQYILGGAIIAMSLFPSVADAFSGKT